MRPPPLIEAARYAAGRVPDRSTVEALVTELVEALGPAQVSTVESARRAASTDFAHLSPLLPAVLPQRPADVVVYPRTMDEIVTAVAHAQHHRVPITPRGRGTGNYGQAVPLAQGLVLDLTRCDQVIDVGDGWIRAAAGATFVALEAAARRQGQEIAMMPTTVGSTIGGFLAGGAGGVGSIEHGWLWDDFVLALDVVICPDAGPAVRTDDGAMVRTNGGAMVRTVKGVDCLPYLHAYGVTGIIGTAMVRLAPARDWIAVLASFPEAAWTRAGNCGLDLLRQQPPPRLVSLDEPGLVATYPADPAMPAGRHSLRAIVDAHTLDAVREIVSAHDGRVEAVRPDGVAYLTSLGFNHVTLRARKANAELCHLQVSGDALLTAAGEVRAALPGAMLHLDGLRTFVDPAAPATGRRFGGLLLSRFQDAETLYDGIERLHQLGVHVVDPHSWLLGGPALPGIRTAAAANDPGGLLNPGKLPPP
jgi:FAD/FMN-containing dehydrogenase